jgi:hypothetical protein
VHVQRHKPLSCCQFSVWLCVDAATIAAWLNTVSVVAPPNSAIHVELSCSSCALDFCHSSACPLQAAAAVACVAQSVKRTAAKRLSPQA